MEKEAFLSVSISALNHYLYCSRRCALIYLEDQFEENLHTQQGRREHEIVDQEASVSRDGLRLEFALPVWSERLGLVGRCDRVEFHEDGLIVPVEHKHGRKQIRLNDDVQLCAQALCLEEIFKVSIEKGVIYHTTSHRRRWVTLDSALRQQTEQSVEAVRRLLLSHRLPSAEKTPRCRGCSLQDICLPDAGLSIETDLFMPRPEEDLECISF
ncbi:CRISPR-associated protein Cas4 [Magnetococcales bacterium HHB-1]